MAWLVRFSFIWSGFHLTPNTTKCAPITTSCSPPHPLVQRTAKKIPKCPDAGFRHLPRTAPWCWYAATSAGRRHRCPSDSSREPPRRCSPGWWRLRPVMVKKTRRGPPVRWEPSTYSSGCVPTVTGAESRPYSTVLSSADILSEELSRSLSSRASAWVRSVPSLEGEWKWHFMLTNLILCALLNYRRLVDLART